MALFIYDKTETVVTRYYVELPDHATDTQIIANATHELGGGLERIRKITYEDVRRAGN